METSKIKTSTPGLQRMAVGDLFTTQSRSCAEHGPYLSMKTPVGYSDCPVCNAVRIKAEDARLIAEAQAEHRAQRMTAMIGRAAIPPRFASKTFASFNAYAEGPARALRVLQGYADNFESAMRTGASLILCGEVGNGKTHLAAAAANSVMERGYSAVFASVSGAIRAVKDTYSRDSKITEGEAISRWIAPDLLVLDEVGVQHDSKTEQLILFEILNGRYERLKPTIVLGNFPMKAEKGLPSITGFLGDRVADRLREGGGRVVVFDWESYRGKAA